jgi:flagellar hook-length control protein FliK
LAPGLAVSASTSVGGASTNPSEATPGGSSQPLMFPAAQVGLAISRNAEDGLQSFTMQLRPERLGTVDVKLDVDDKGHATASFIADRPETLALLRQDANHLVKSLNEAGVNTDAGSLNFSLRNSSNGSAEADEQRGSFGQNGGRAAMGGGGSADTETAAPVYRSTGTNRLYDIHA